MAVGEHAESKGGMTQFLLFRMFFFGEFGHRKQVGRVTHGVSQLERFTDARRSTVPKAGLKVTISKADAASRNLFRIGVQKSLKLI